MEQNVDGVLIAGNPPAGRRPGATAFVILGFLTGLALSAMIGAVLYIYLTLGS
jgi:hypothetical protein